MITADTFGDSKQFPSLISLAEIINEANNANMTRNVSRFLNDMHSVYKSISHLDKKPRRYFHELIKNDFLERASNNWKDGYLTDKIYSHLCCYTIGYCRMMNKTFAHES